MAFWEVLITWLVWLRKGRGLKKRGCWLKKKVRGLKGRCSRKLNKNNNDLFGKG